MDDIKRNEDAIGTAAENTSEKKMTLDQEAAEMAKNDRIELLGPDGGLVALFAALVIIMFCSLKFKIDVLSGYVFPIMLLIIVCVVTIAYLKTLGKFIRGQNAIARENKANDASVKNDEK
jgi:ABC-type protease/lipase transport system fused ATPase/permease subunit